MHTERDCGSGLGFQAMIFSDEEGLRLVLWLQAMVFLMRKKD
jgi:hypothetical protein